PIDFNPRKCLFKVKGICFGHPFYAHGMSYTDCKAIQKKYGIKVCRESDDVFASTAYVCGGTKYMPTPDELLVLANHMYDTNAFRNYYRDFIEVTRNNSKSYLEYFRNIEFPDKDFNNFIDEQHYYNFGFNILSNREKFPEVQYNDALYVYIRKFRPKGSSVDSMRRAYPDSQAFSICVQRDNDYVTPTKQKYPIMKKPQEVIDAENNKKNTKYNKEAENALF
ncbi:MAG: hypothetical protein NC200_07085, partial [Candidatus Gastranaerophilales bacterium]|nr:hypothetical protein [Candidatus Gastranaerophilales bacterium]